MLYCILLLLYIIHTLLYYILYIYYYYILYYYTYYIFHSSSPHLPQSSILFSSIPINPPLPYLLFFPSTLLFFLPFLNISFILYLSVLTYTYLYYLPHSFSNKLSINIKRNTHLSLSQRNTSSINSFYTCRYLHILIYIQSIFPFNPNI